MASIFIVDDETYIVDLYREILTSNGHFIAGVAYDGAEALDKYARSNPKPDFILMDNRMPVMSGLDALKEIMRMNPSQRVIFISAEVSIEQEVRENGALEFLSKPFRLADLLAKLERFVEDGERKRPSIEGC